MGRNFRMSECGRVEWEPLLHTPLCQAGILGWKGIYVFFGIDSGQRGNRSEKPLFLYTEPAHRRWSTWIRKAVKNEKRKKWEESKGTAFSKGKKKTTNKAAWDQLSEAITTKLEGSRTWASTQPLAEREGVWCRQEFSWECWQFYSNDWELWSKKRPGYINQCGTQLCRRASRERPESTG